MNKISIPPNRIRIIIYENQNDCEIGANINDKHRVWIIIRIVILKGWFEIIIIVLNIIIDIRIKLYIYISGNSLSKILILGINDRYYLFLKF